MSSREPTLYDSLLNTVDAGIIVLDRDGRIVIWNNWIATASTIAAESAVGQLLSDLFPKIAGTRLSSAIDDSLRFGTSSILTHSLHNAIFPLSTSTGRTMVHNVSVRPLNGMAHSCLVQVSDVTIPAERDRILRERQNARYDAVVASAPDSIITLSTDGIVQFANPAATKQFGYLGADLIGIGAEVLFEHPDQWSHYWKLILTSTPPPSPLELKGRRKDGSSTYLEISGSAWQSHSRLFVTVILRDVNARRAAEDALREINQTLEQRVAERTADRDRMWRLSTDLMLVMKLNGTITAINPAWSVFLGWDEAELTGSNLSNFITTEDRPKWDAAFSDLLKSRRPRICEVRVRTRAGSSRVIAWSAVIGHDFVQAAGRDVTAEREAEESLRHAEQALRQSQKMDAIGQLTGGIAHDFNNLLTGIMGALSIIKRRIAANRNEEVASLIDAGIASATRAAALVHRLLAFARQQPLDPQPLDLNQLIDGMMDLVRRSLGEQIGLERKLGVNVWPVMTDANQLENALLNLVINSRDAMPAGGHLTIETSNVTIGRSEGDRKSEIEAGDYASVSVSDTGSGMPAGILAKVFDPFFTTKPLGQGTGLGLSMVYGFVKQSNGHVQIQSEVEKGTTIKLLFPRHRGEVSHELPATSPEAPRGAGETVLLVEDDSSVRMLIADVLRDLGYACVEAHDGLAALPILNSSMRIDLLITDVGLPGLNGRQVADIGRQRRPDLKVLFVTGYSAHATVRAGLVEAGMDMITKPFNLDDLAIKIRSMIE
jgi:PAS domain S-box-containing protein